MKSATKKSGQSAPRIVGSIGAARDIRELSTFTKPIRQLVVYDTTGELHGIIQWLEGEVDERFAEALGNLCDVAFRPRHSGGAA